MCIIRKKIRHVSINHAVLRSFQKRALSGCLPEPSSFPSWSFEQRPFFRYELVHQSTKSMARVGRIITPHGIIETPSYVPVATNAALKGVDFRNLDANVDQHEGIDQYGQLVFSNTYHLILHPGREVIRDAGGIHKFTGRNQPFITDSGGFQVFSLAYGSVQAEREQHSELKRGHTVDKPYWSTSEDDNEDPVEVTEDGVMFRSYRDGSKIFISPEITVDAQKDFGADIIIPLDELPPHHISRSTLVDSVARSHRWEARSLRQHLKNVNGQAMYCVIHGGLDVELRKQSVEYLTSLPFDGFAIGGSLGKDRDELKNLLNWMMPMFEKDNRRNKPRHLLGIADEESIRHAVTRGIDTLDSCYPTKLGRHGTFMTSDGLLRIKQGKHKKSFGKKIDETCQCATCRNYDRAYLHHLFKAKEPLAVMLGTQHNLFYMQNMMKKIRKDILDNRI
ncbi:queuine tRNA-ribosyltransferase [Chaetoceros tenuissimus]|uniref:Queuine tRNA-ribosyltransferase n=1 Tax=Chaetoceros tenuissimus TaxID=426638 RepID=A0AAD3DAA1_9STRA|nr:queuine tRNA-ribosyltransferase [Chaetoceros tenuissimus]